MFYKRMARLHRAAPHAGGFRQDYAVIPMSKSITRREFVHEPP
jgi:hypothetical protein